MCETLRRARVYLIRPQVHNLGLVNKGKIVGARNRTTWTISPAFFNLVPTHFLLVNAQTRSMIPLCFFLRGDIVGCCRSKI